MNELKETVDFTRKLLQESMTKCRGAKFVLVVDDDYSSTSLVSTFLKTKKIHDFIVSSLEAAIDLLYVPEVFTMVGAAIVDVNFNKGDINDLIQLLVEKKIPVVLYTSNDEYQSVLRPEFQDKFHCYKKGSLQTLRSLYECIVSQFEFDFKISNRITCP